MKDFAYCSPSSVEGVCELLATYRGRATVLAGGQSLLPVLRLGMASPEVIIDINNLSGCDHLHVDGDHLAIGCLVRHADVARSATVRDNCLVLAEVAGGIGDVQIRNRGTICGSLAQADPAGDPPVLATLLNADIVATDATGETVFEGDGFFAGLFETELEPTQLITEVRFPILTDGQGAAYEKWEISEGAYPVATVGAFVEFDDGTVTDARIVTGAVEFGPTRFADAEALLVDERPDAQLLERVAAIVRDDSNPIEDAEGSVRFKRELVRTLTERALTTAVNRATEAVLA
ncbi:xanthine dehydrogenase family protein subunit M [Haladaptatus sp. DJG-WS-42]|uniref:FAD binding domain-containing protein n=1 Tax=Haladaptatus sp. DJG-WS-42 TaxID=3120516 RepID=UPI0030D44F49